MISFGAIMVLWLVDVVATNAESPTSKGLLTYLSILSHLDDFMKGVLSTSHIIFYISLMLVGLFLTYRSIDSLRWSDVADVMERVARAHPVEGEERDGQQAHDEEDLAAQRLAQAVAGDRPDGCHEVSPPTAST